jgi:S-formylglutathione hydrolase FrmB
VRRPEAAGNYAVRVCTALAVVMYVLLGLSWWTAPSTKASTVEYLMVPSASMGRDIPVAFMAGGPHAVYLLDAFDADPDVSNWVSKGDAVNVLAGRGISVAAPAGGAYSMYTNWEQDGSRQWDTFLSRELPDWLTANKGLALGGHAVVGAAQGGYAALALAAFHPDRFRYAGSMSGFLAPERTGVDGATPRACNSTAASTPATCGAHPSLADGSGTRPMRMRTCWSTTAPACGCTALRRFPPATPRR